MFGSKSAGIMDAIASAIDSETEGVLDYRARRARRTGEWSAETPADLLVRRETYYATARTLGWNR